MYALIEPHFWAIVDGIAGSIVLGGIVLLLRPFRLRLVKRFRGSDVHLCADAAGVQSLALAATPLDGIGRSIDDASVFKLLSWHVRLVPVTGYEVTTGELLHWAREPSGKPIALLSGPGGIGKTRLAGELAYDLLRARRCRSAGFVERTTSIVATTPALLIVDYPEERLAYALSLLKEIAASNDRARHVRILLLSRKPLADWNAAFDRTGVETHVHVIEMPAAALGDEQASALFNSALDRLCEHFRKQRVRAAADEFATWLAWDPALHRRPLFIIAAAIQSAIDEKLSLALHGGEIIKGLVRREMKRLRKASSTELGFWDAEAGARLAALAVVRGELQEADLRRFADPKLEIGLPPKERVVAAVEKLPWWKAGHWQTDGPDIVGAALVFEVLSGRPDMASEWLWSAVAGTTPKIADRLARLIHDVRTVYEDGGAFVDWITAVAEHPERALAIEPLMSESHLPVTLWPLAVKTYETLSRHIDAPEHLAYVLQCLARYRSMCGAVDEALDAYRRAVDLYGSLDANDVVTQAETAQTLSSYSKALADSGQLVAALAVNESAVQFYEHLTGHDALFDGSLALALTERSTFLAALGRIDDALAITGRAIEINRRLVSTSPGHFDDQLAGSLTNLSVYLDEAGDSARAFQASEEAVAIYRRLYESRPLSHGAGYGTCLNNLSQRLHAAGKMREARALSEQAIEIFRILARYQPRRFDEDLATTLQTLAFHLIGEGHESEAADAMTEAVAICRRLVAVDPQRYDELLAHKLDALCRVLNGPEVRPVAEETLSIFRRLAAARPREIEPHVAESLVLLAGCLADERPIAEAVSHLDEAVRIAGRCGGDMPQRFEPALARTYCALANVARSAGSAGEGEELLRSAVTIFRRLSEERSRDFDAETGQSLSQLGYFLSQREAYAEGMDVYREAAAAYRRAAHEQPGRFDAALRGVLNVLATLERSFGRPIAELDVYNELVAIERRMAREDPAGFEEALARTLSTLGNRLEDFGRTDEAIDALREAAEFYSRLASVDAARYGLELGETLNTLACRYSDVGQTTAALAAAEGSADVLRRCSPGSSEAHSRALASSLQTLSRCRTYVPDPTGALAAIAECVEIYRGLASAGSFQREMAGALNDFSVCLGHAGAGEEAHDVAREAVASYRHLLVKHPRHFESELANGLVNLAMRAGDTGKTADAYAAIREAVSIYRRLSETAPCRFESDLAAALFYLALYCGKSGEEAAVVIPPLEESVAILQRYAKERPERFDQNLGPALVNLAHWLNAAGESSRALSAIEGAVEIFRRLSEASPQQFTENYVFSLDALAARHREHGNEREADAAQLELERVGAGRIEFRARIVASLAAHSSWLNVIGHMERALGAYERLITEFRCEQDEEIRDIVSTALVEKGRILLAVGDRMDEAFAAEDEAVERFMSDEIGAEPANELLLALFLEGCALAGLGRNRAARAVWHGAIARFGDATDPAVTALVQQCVDARAALVGPKAAVKGREDV
jgi:tetratricopeptide (TPR) repeat protein